MALLTGVISHMDIISDSGVTVLTIGQQELYIDTEEALDMIDAAGGEDSLYTTMVGVSEEDGFVVSWLLSRMV